MQDALQIQDIRLDPLAPNAITPAMAASADAWYELVLTVRSAAYSALFVLSDVRRMVYDEAARALVIEFSERNVPATPRRRRQLPANFVELKPGGTTALTYRISSPVIFTFSPAGEATAPRFVRVPADVDAIRCTVAFDDAPPRQLTNLASHETGDDVRRWGRTVERHLQLRGRDAV